MAGLTYYGLMADLRRMRDRQETMQVDLLKLSRTYPSLANDERFKRTQEQNTSAIAELKEIMAEYDELNRKAEKEADEPKDYYAALSYVIDTGLQETCKHPTDSWVKVINVPAEKRQYEKNSEDWLCSMCGLLVPPF